MEGEAVHQVQPPSRLHEGRSRALPQQPFLTNLENGLASEHEWFLWLKGVGLAIELLEARIFVVLMMALTL
jgi:hypothetical protein